MLVNIASPVRRLGAFIIDQVILGIFNLIALATVAYTQQDALGVIGQKFMEFSQNNNGAANEELQRRFNETFAQNPDVISAASSLLVPFAVWIVISLLISAIYYIFLTTRNGQTWGKKLLKIKVVTEAGEAPSFLASTERYFLYVGLSSFSSILSVVTLLVYRTLETPNGALSLIQTVLDLIIFVLFFIGALLIVTRPDKRGYHDLGAGTFVVKS